MSATAALREIAAHEQDATFREHVLVGEHAERAESAEFRRNKARILAEQGARCWLDTDVCDRGRPIEAHHVAEWAMWPKVDPDRLAAVLLTFDPYGYSRAMLGVPITSPDDIRNLIALCDRCHRAIGLGAHHLSFPTWLARKARRAGESITREEAALRAA